MLNLLNDDILKRTECYVRRELEEDCTDNDWWHIHRVRNKTLSIAKEEKADLFIVQLVACLHDLTVHKFNYRNETIGSKVSHRWLESLNLD